jgi:radical SAM superfamily enzyme with C-terminal helix-hairpin-helix motif
MLHRALIFDCYTVEPAGLGVPPYLSTYVRYAYASLRASGVYDDIAYATIDDFRAAVGIEDTQAKLQGYTDPLTYSLTTNAPQILELLSTADLVVVIAGDAVPSMHLHAKNGELEEIAQAMDAVQGKRLLLGPASNALRASSHPLHHLFDAYHSQNFSPETMMCGSIAPLRYGTLNSVIETFELLLAQIPWQVIAEIELYRGCTRKQFCSFCNEPIKNRLVDFRAPEEIIREVGLLYDAGVRHFRLGQQACFFSYFHRDEAKIAALLSGIRERCPLLEVLHIDNVDPLAAASPQGRTIAKLVVEYCTEGNCAPMGMETFDPSVIKLNHLTCTPEVLLRAISHIEEEGASIGPLGQRKLLAGINLIYGLPGETRRTHFENMRWLLHILEAGHLCHRTNVRQVRVYQETALSQLTLPHNETFEEDFRSWKRDIADLYDRPMKERVYPSGQVLRGLHAFLLNEKGTWFRRLGSYPIMVIDADRSIPRYEQRDLVVTGHAGRYIYGQALEAARGS